MPSTGQYPLSLFTTVRQALQLLEKEDINPADFLQAIIDNPSFRKDVVQAYSQDITASLYGIPDQPQNLTELATFTTGRRYRDPEKEERTLRRTFGADSDYIAERIAWAIEDNATLDETVRFFENHNNFVKAFTYLDEMSVSIVVATLGLSDGIKMTQQDVADMHRITAHHFDALRSRAWRVMGPVVKHLLETGKVPSVEQLPIEFLDLPKRIRNMLKRQGINHVADLTARSHVQLMAFVRLGQQSVNEIEEELSEHGLSLKQ